MSEYKRLKFDFSVEAIERLDEIVKLTGSSSRGKALRNALSLYEYIVDKYMEGYQVEFTKDGEQPFIVSRESDHSGVKVSQSKEHLIDRYFELLMHVGNKHPGETRHETALRYIKERETTICNGAKNS